MVVSFQVLLAADLPLDQKTIPDTIGS